jgi:hypothetical protein
MVTVEVAPEVSATVRAMKDRGAFRQRCHEGVLRSAVGGLVRRLLDDDLDGATPRSSYVRGVIVDGDRGVLLSGGGDSALVVDG